MRALSNRREVEEGDRVAVSAAMTTMRTSCKPPQTTEAPWAVLNPGSISSPLTTYASAYNSPVICAPPTPIRPKEQHPWKTAAKFDTRSTSQDAYHGTGGGPRSSCKPQREYEPVNWPSKPVTTNNAMFIPHYGLAAKREPFRPKLKEVDGSKFETRSTQQDSYQSVPGHTPRGSIYPKEKPYEYTKFDHTSTSRAAYISHKVSPFVPPKKPKASMGNDGIMA